VSGALTGPAAPLAMHGGALVMPRFWAAVAVALGMHVAFLAIRPGGVAGSHVAPPARTIAVRVLHPVAATDSAVAAAERAQESPAATPAAVAAVPPATADYSAQPTPARSLRPTREASSEAARGLASERAPLPAAAAVAPAAAMPSADAALPAAPEYAFGVRLDPGPHPLEDIEPEYPDVHLREGTVVLRLLISETGHVDDVAVVRAAPRGVFDQAALDAFGKAKFAPGFAAGTPVKSQITVEVRFVPINRGARVSGRSY